MRKSPANSTQFLRFHGTLFENMVFEPRPGWETKHIVGSRPEGGDGTFLIELLSMDAKVLVSLSPQVIMHGPCFGNGERQWADVVIYLPLHPDARELVFRRQDRELYRCQITSKPPQLHLAKPTKLTKDRIRINWRATHSKPLTFQVLYLAEDGRAFSLAADLTESKFTADLRMLPGGRGGRLGVLATDGLRSSFERSGPFRVEEKPPRVWIQSPGPDEILPPDQPVTLIGHAVDVGGLSLADTGLQWLVDGNTALADSRVGMAMLEPGPHEIVLRYALKGRVVAEQRVQFTIAGRSAAQELYLKSVREMIGPQ